jgi:plastocyanin
MKNIKSSLSRFFIVLAITSAVLTISNSCTKSTAYNTPTTPGSGSKGAGSPGANEVFIQSMAFTPSSLTVMAGTTVKWTNQDAIGHTVTSNTNLFNSGTLGNGSSFSFTFATAGTYSYYCSIHPTMVGQITVQ